MKRGKTSMCIIVVKKIGLQVPDKNILKTCFENNPDGAGFMWNDGKNVYFRKGFMDFNDFYKNLQKENKRNNFKEKQLVIHFRIGTGGGNVPKNTHPFVVSQDVKQLEKLAGTCQTALMHNGIISAYSRYNRDATTSDTMDYITDFLSLIPVKTLKSTKLWGELAKQCNSRFVYMWNENLILSGAGWQKDNGYYFSNTGYKPRPKVTYVNNIYNNFASYYKNANDRLPVLKKRYNDCEICGNTGGKYTEDFDAYICDACLKKELEFNYPHNNFEY